MRPPEQATVTPPSGGSVAPTPSFVRVHEGFVFAQEKRLLLAMAARTPEWITPDILTGLGIFASLLVAVSYILTGYNPNFFHLANFGIVLHWYGDSMDGTLARYRSMQRPNYGLFVDMMSDMFAAAFILVGMGHSIFNLYIALSLLASFYLITIVHLFILKFRNSHHVSTGGFSGTEARAILISANLLWYFYPTYEMYLVVNGVAGFLTVFLTFMVILSSLDLLSELKTQDEKVLAAIKIHNPILANEKPSRVIEEKRTA